MKELNPLPGKTSIRPLQIKQIDSMHLSLVWSDGHQGRSSMTILRDACPCAGCSGETVLLHTYVPGQPERNTPGRYELKSVDTVGEYALKFVWGDGHDMGLYTWEHLRSLCECPECAGKRASVQSQ